MCNFIHNFWNSPRHGTHPQAICSPWSKHKRKQKQKKIRPVDFKLSCNLAITKQVWIALLNWWNKNTHIYHANFISILFQFYFNANMKLMLSGTDTWKTIDGDMTYKDLITWCFVEIKWQWFRWFVKIFDLKRMTGRSKSC